MGTRMEHNFVLHYVFHFLAIWTSCCGSDSRSPRPRIDIINPGFYSLYSAPSLWQGEPVFAAGIDYLRATYPQFHWTYESVSDPTVKNCVDLRDNVQFLLARWYYAHRSSNVTSLPLIITFGCENAAEMNALAAAWDVLLITGLDFRPDMQNRQLYPTLLSSAEMTPSLSVLYCELFRMTKWSKLYILHDRESSDYYRGRDRNMVASLKELCSVSLQVTRSVFSHFDNDTSVEAVLMDFNARSRIMMFLGDSDGLRKILVTASQLNMTKGEHVYLAVLPFESDMFGKPALWKPTKKDDEVVYEAYQSVALVRLVDESRYKTPAMDKFIQKWLAYPGPDKEIRNKLPNLASLHIGLELAGIAVNLTYTGEMQREKGLTPSGTALANSLLNRTFDLDVGETYVMASAQVSHRHFVSSYDLASKDYKDFLRSSSDPLTDIYRWNYVPGGQWFGRTTFPPDEPLCGFDGNARRCRGFAKIEQPIIITFGCLLLLCLLLGLLLKSRQTHHLLYDIWWVIPVTQFVTMKRRDSAFHPSHV